MADSLHAAIYWLDESEHARALDALRREQPDQIVEYNGISEGWLAWSDVGRLLKAGFTIDLIDKATLGLEVDDDTVTRELGSHRRASDLVHDERYAHLADLLQRFEDSASDLDRGEPPLDAAVDQAGGRAIAPAEPRRQIYHLRLRGRLSQAVRDQLAGFGVQLLAFERHRWYVASLLTDNVGRVLALPFVTDIHKRAFGEALSADFLVALEEAASAQDETPRLLDLTVPDPTDVQLLAALVERRPHVDVVEATGSTLRIRAPLSSATVASLANRPEVAMVAPVREAQLSCDYARVLIGVSEIGDITSPLRGDGEIVAVLDSGLDATHPDLVGAAVNAEALAGGDADDVFGHGTHVAGIIRGSGAASGGKICGVAPQAKLSITKITDGAQLQLPADLAGLLEQATADGAKIVNLSLGADAPTTGSVYDRYSFSTDDFVAKHPDVLVVVAAGNAGAEDDQGESKLATVMSPGTAKNVVTVGASSTDRPEITDRWGEFRPAVFHRPPLSDQPIAGNPDLPAANSGRGPGSYGLIKPEVLAPGTFILSARAAKIKPELPWRDCHDYGGKYVFIGGSSMAAPFVAGAAAIVREYLLKRSSKATPSAALLKAVLVAATLRLPPTRTPGTPTSFGYPDFDQGFGRLDLNLVLPNGKAPSKRRLETIDVWNDDPDALESRAPPNAQHKSMHAFVASVPAGATDPLRVVLCWTDAPSTAVQNDLGLQLIGPDSSRFGGNAEHRYGRDALVEHPDANGILWDERNTIEQVVVPKPIQGEYEIRVVARNTVMPPQGFALVVAGELEGELRVRG
jgi:serine protease AprX